MTGGRKFIRSINFETSPSCVIATDSQLQNVTKFCTSPSSHCVWGIDPSFNMGKFYVTITMYTYTHVVKRGGNVSPTFFVPIFIHTEKSFVAYYCLTLFRLIGRNNCSKLESSLSLLLTFFTGFDKDILEGYWLPRGKSRNFFKPRRTGPNGTTLLLYAKMFYLKVLPITYTYRNYKK